MAYARFIERLSRLRGWLPWTRWRVEAIVPSADEMPEALPRKGVVVVGDVRKAKWISFDCPCGNGHRIMLPLDQRQKPHWRLLDADRVTLSPSIDYRGETRRCHFFMMQGRIVWVKDRGVR